MGDAGKEGFRPGGIQNRRDTGKETFRRGRMQDRMDAVQEEAGKNG